MFNRQCFLCGQSSENAAALETISDAAHDQKFRSQIELIVPALSLIGENFHRSCYSTLIAKRRRLEIKRGKQAQSVTLDDQVYPSFLAQDDDEDGKTASEQYNTTHDDYDQEGGLLLF
ncbi:unnamed protein product [Didymodactylos carnosus]|uniref:Uncharacterized protein n=1 Tax=Didymodactylos carnosus TaxID=1234261 RepID=A0A8S2S7Q2_9BILA|nr:unnamed protein product [Didymodactylos carnosus]CAF4210885.1 unnamed protein product [Didymodactylos carnosus]